VHLVIRETDLEEAQKLLVAEVNDLGKKRTPPWMLS
jgi:hypothetical protein